jgi:hypothetical protein
MLYLTLLGEKGLAIPKLTKIGVAAIPGIIDVVEDYFAVPSKYVHLTRFLEFGIGLIGCAVTGVEGFAANASEALTLSSEPLVIKSLYSLITGAIEGQPTKEEIIARLRRAGAFAPQIRKPRFH